MAKTIIKGSTKKQAGSRPPKPEAPVVQHCGPALSHGDIEEMIYRAAQKILNRDMDAKQPGPELSMAMTPKTSGASALNSPARSPMLPVAIDQLNKELEHLHDTMCELEQRLEGVLLPGPAEVNGDGILCAAETAPPAVRAVQGAARRVAYFASQARTLIERLEA